MVAKILRKFNLQECHKFYLYFHVYLRFLNCLTDTAWILQSIKMRRGKRLAVCFGPEHSRRATSLLPNNGTVDLLFSPTSAFRTITSYQWRCTASLRIIHRSYFDQINDAAYHIRIPLYLYTVAAFWIEGNLDEVWIGPGKQHVAGNLYMCIHTA